MPASATSPSLRERKKARTRLAIRQEAFRLFDQQGYANTTIDQIAHAADVSPRTLYRYFGVKEALLVSDDHTTPIVEAFANAPRELSIVAAYRHALTEVFGALTPEERENSIAGQRMLYQVPEARGLIYAEYIRLIDLLTAALARRPDAPNTEMERRVVAAAIVGVLMTVSHDSPLPEDALQRALTILDAKLR
ncbi:TetR family transcriptional regulator [Mycolicibacterium aurum]|uniref:TetR family transcriptional regulator n=1 Tax=Mycolicibacterium aurum TaxID=1791 RepID=A0A3S4RMX8_MYCAU|nr:TetR/AcrR family transcriptional regulator [Mycolicibacterium aurum]VEG51797.1 TetR family transcriptional regulator [Mycolicibacterium aurum]